MSLMILNKIIMFVLVLILLINDFASTQLSKFQNYFYVHMIMCANFYFSQK